VLGTLSAALFYILARHPEIGAGLSPLSPVAIDALWPIVIGIGIIALLAVTWPSLRALQTSALPRLNKFLARIDWKQLVKREPAFVLIFFATLGAAIFHYLSRNPEIATGLATVLPVAIVVGLLVAAVVSLTESLKRLVERLGFAPLFTRPDRMLGMSTFIAAALGFLLVQPSLYAAAGALETIWRAALKAFADYTIGGALFISLMLLLAAWHACGPSAVTPRTRLPRGLLAAFAALLFAYVFVFFTFTGYVFTGYFARYLSLTVYFNDLLLALGLVVMMDCAYGWYAAFKQSRGWNGIGRGSGAALAAIGCAGVVAYWASLQTVLVRKLPPDAISFFPILSEPPFRGGTFAASIYGGTTAYFNKNWAYFDSDSTLAQGHVTLGPDGYQVKRDDAYVWFADRRVNAAYDKPQYFLAMTFLYHGLMHGRGPGYLMGDESAPRPRVGDIPIIRAIREQQTSYLHPVEVARDPSPLDRWSIIRLDWDYPPFLRQLEDGEFVQLDASSNESGTRVRVDYRYAHQENVLEDGTRITLFAWPRCTGPEHSVEIPAIVAGGREFILPASFAGIVRAEVQPATATTPGPIYGSRRLTIGFPGACQETSAVSK
jgi:hypothetical protein